MNTPIQEPESAAAAGARIAHKIERILASDAAAHAALDARATAQPAIDAVHAYLDAADLAAHAALDAARSALASAHAALDAADLAERSARAALADLAAARCQRAGERNGYCELDNFHGGNQRRACNCVECRELRLAHGLPERV